MKKLIQKLLSWMIALVPDVGRLLRPLLSQYGERLPELYEGARSLVLDLADDFRLNGSQKHSQAVDVLKDLARNMGITLATWAAHQIVAQAFSELVERGVLTNGGAKVK